MAVSKEDLEAYLSSWAGCDGGNPKGIWICGIEYGGEVANLREAIGHYEESSRDSAVPAGWNDAYREKYKGEYLTWRYHQKVAKLMLALRAFEGGENADISAMSNFRDYMRNELYRSDGETFKLNLYPLSSPSVNSPKWNSAYHSNPILSSKSGYYDLCSGARFDFLRNKRKKIKPRLIIATGKSAQLQFVQAFGFDRDKCHSVFVETPSARRECCIYQDADSTLLVTPFLGGRHGLNSNKLLLELARIIRTEGLLSVGSQRESDDS